jgi:hypothetical protein
MSFTEKGVILQAQLRSSNISHQGGPVNQLVLNCQILSLLSSKVIIKSRTPFCFYYSESNCLRGMPKSTKGMGLFLSDWRPAMSLSALSSRSKGSAESEAAVGFVTYPWGKPQP